MWSVVNGTVVFSSEPFHWFFLWNSVFGSDSGFASSSQTNSASWSFEDDVEVHTENTGEWIILDTEIDVLLNTESEVTSVREVGFSQFSVLDLEASFEDFVGLIASDGDVHGHFLVSLDTEGSDGESGSGWDGLLSSEIFKDLGGWIMKEDYLWWAYHLINRHRCWGRSFRFWSHALGFIFRLWPFDVCGIKITKEINKKWILSYFVFISVMVWFIFLSSA